MSLKGRFIPLIRDILKRTDPMLRRRWMVTKDLLKLWRAMSDIQDTAIRKGNKSLMHTMNRVTICFLYYQIPENEREEIIAEIVHALPFMLAFLKAYHLSGLETLNHGEKRRRQAEKDWNSGKDKPSEDF